MSYAYDPALAVAALERVNARPYRIGLRSLFYMLLQDGLLASKGDYARLKDILSRARHNCLDGWMPDTLVDDTRSIDESDEPLPADRMLARLPFYVDLKADLYEGAGAVPFLIYEARGSAPQFAHFAPWADRAGLSGDASIPHKYAIAKRCEALNEAYGVPAHILYFGDYDNKGREIPKRLMADVRKWTGAEIRFTRVGLNAGDNTRFNIPEKPESPGTYEWDALTDTDAGALIHDGLSSVVDVEQVEARIAAAGVETLALRERVRATLDAMP